MTTLKIISVETCGTELSKNCIGNSRIHGYIRFTDGNEVEYDTEFGVRARRETFFPIRRAVLEEAGIEYLIERYPEYPELHKSSND